MDDNIIKFNNVSIDKALDIIIDLMSSNVEFEIIDNDIPNAEYNMQLVFESKELAMEIKLKYL